MGRTYFPFGLGAGKIKKFALADITEVNLGAPITADIDAILDGATGTELPNTETVTYTTANIGTSPCDGVSTTWILDVPRNVVITTTHAASIVAMSFLVTGKDVYGQTMSELLTVTATGTSKTSNGLKAFKCITSIALTAAADAEANTVEVGFGDVLGLPFLMSRNTVLKEIEDNAVATAGTVVVAVTTSPATTTTGDVRGTYDPNSACNGAKVFRLIAMPTSLISLGVTQA